MAQGVEIGLAQMDEKKFILLAPAYLSTQDNVKTISPGALKRYSNCTQSTHVALESLVITINHNTYTLPTTIAGGLNYINLKLHHFTHPLKTKLFQNPHLRAGGRKS